VIFIPGIKGSVLKRGNKVLWGNTRVVRLSSLDDLTVPLPKQDVLPQERFDQRDSQGRRIVSTEILGDFDVRLFFPFRVTVEVPIYQRFRDILVKAAKFSPGSTVFFFDYDWRLDNRVAAVALAGALPDLRAKYNESYLRDYCAPHGSIDQCLERVRANPDWKHLVGPNGIKFNIVTHSMGGLVARYLIRGLGYGDEVHNLILVSAPNQGAMDAMRGVVVGEGDTYEDALADVRSAIEFHAETFGNESLDVDPPVLEAFVAEAGIKG